MSEPTAGSKRKIGLALGGGGARGLAHIGVLKVLERADVSIAMLAGTSMGGIIGSLWVAGHPAAEIEAEVLKISRPRDMHRLVDLQLSQGGFVKGARIYDLLAEILGTDLTFADLDHPFAVVASDTLTGREVILSEGRVVDAVRATISIPGVFQPVQLDDMHLVDGGILNNVPVDVVRTMGADTVIAVDVLPDYSQNEPGQPPLEPMIRPEGLPSIANKAYDVIMIMLSAMTHWRLQATPPDCLIRPDVPPDVGLLLGFERAAEIIAAGERAAVEAFADATLPPS